MDGVLRWWVSGVPHWWVLVGLVLVAGVAGVAVSQVYWPGAGSGVPTERYRLQGGQPRYFEVNMLPHGEVMLEALVETAPHAEVLGNVRAFEVIADGDGVEWYIEVEDVAGPPWGVRDVTLHITDYGDADVVLVNFWLW